MLGSGVRLALPGSDGAALALTALRIADFGSWPYQFPLTPFTDNGTLNVCGP